MAREIKRAKVLDGKICVDDKPIEYELKGIEILESNTPLNQEQRKKLAEANMPENADTYYMRKKVKITREYSVLYMKRK